MRTDAENFLGVHRVINDIGPSVDEGRWDDLQAYFADDATLDHPFAGKQQGAETIVGRIGKMGDGRIGSHHFAGNIRIAPSDGDAVFAKWDVYGTQIHPSERGDDQPLIFAGGTGFSAEFRLLEGKWRIVDLTVKVIWMDPALLRFIHKKMGIAA